MTLLRYEHTLDGGEIPVYGCPPHVREQGLVPRLPGGAAFVGHRNTSPTAPIVCGPRPTPGGAPVPCAECTELTAAGRDPQRIRTGHASLDLYRLIEHRIAAHDTAPTWREDCDACARWQAGGRGIAATLAAHWSRHHGVMHTLGIASGGAGKGLCFADQPADVPLHTAP
ncbi:hypothetical protein [Actinacidiphila reveromycinica]|nr:hypothetical protein [Streptomyces sp. SN-593]